MVPLREEDFPGVFVRSSLDSKLLYDAKLLALATLKLPMPWVIPAQAIQSQLPETVFSVIRKSIG